MIDISEVLLQWFINYLTKNPLRLQINLLLVEQLKMSNKELAEELHKPIIEKFGEKKYTHFL